MSDQFYSYLSKKIISYFKDNPLKSGDKFYIQFEVEEQVGKLYNELKQNIISQTFVYHDDERNETYETYELQFENVQLLVASTYDDLHPDFLTMLRNMVGIEKGYENKAILFIHCSTLDSILGGAGSFHKEGMPFHIAQIEKDIKTMIGKTDFSDTDRFILEMYLENKRKDLRGGNPSVFEYSDILFMLGSSYIIKSEDYFKFGLFYDDSLSTLNLSKNKLKQRLEENHSHYIRIAEIHDYGIPDEQLEKYYGGKGQERLKKDDWKLVKYSEIEQFIEDKKDKKVMEYIPNFHDSRYWDREEGSSRTKLRIRNIIFFNESMESIVKMEFRFTDSTKTAGIKIPTFCKDVLECVASGKKLQVVLKDIQRGASFYGIKYEIEGIKFDFRIVVLDCCTKYLESLKTIYSIRLNNKIDECAVYINSEDDKIVINEFGNCGEAVKIVENDQLICIEENKVYLSVDDNYPYIDDSNIVKFRLKIGECVIPMVKVDVVERPIVIDGLKVWKLKRDYKINFEYSDNKLRYGTKLYFARDEFRKNLEMEKIFIDEGELGLYENETGFVSMQLDVDEQIKEAYERVINYFRDNKSLPSLVYMSDEVTNLYQKYLDSVMMHLNVIKDGEYLTSRQKELFCLGMIKRNVEDNEILLTPLHPINIAYQLYLKDIKTDCIADNEYELLRKFQQLYLLPYININPYTQEAQVYTPVEQFHSPEWKTYVEIKLPRYKGSKDYVSKLVAEKIQEFVEHFDYLFDMGEKTPIKINLINTGDSKEILEGIFKYYVKQLQSSRKKEMIPMQISVYTNNHAENAFEEFTNTEDIIEIKEKFHLHLNVHDMNENEIINLYRENVRFYLKSKEDKLEYAHITFLEMEDESQVIRTHMDDIPSGIVMNGISSGTPAVLLGDTYRTGFGTQYTNLKLEVMDVSRKYNAINAAIKGDSYEENACQALSLTKTNQKRLDEIYDSSNWVTFINPRVDLSYFKNAPDTKDLLIIHYSDQYNTTSSGYDAITVTRKSKQYRCVIEEYLTKNGVEEAAAKSPQIINMFNAINGDWLLRLIFRKSYFPKEKLSILSAIKFTIKRYESDGIIWVPISLEEVLRVTGAAGLRQKDSLFSAKNLGFENGGATSDDILLIGIEDGERPRVTFYPIEVKIGLNKLGYIAKGMEQVLETKEIFDKTVGLGICTDKDIRTRIFRNFFMQLVVANAEKLSLYNVGDDKQGWENVTKTDLRRKLLNEEYEIVDFLIPEMGKAGLISFRRNYSKEQEYCCKDVLIVEKTEQEGINILAKDIKEIEAIQWNLILFKDEVEEYEDEESDFIKKKKEKLSENTQEKDDSIISQLHVENKQKDVLSDTIRILIGQDKFMQDVYWEFGNKQLANRHLLITGISGQGKTYSIQTMLYELTKCDVSSIIFDYTEGFTPKQLEEPFVNKLGNKIIQHIIYHEGVPINPFRQHEVEVAGITILEKASDVAARLADIFVHVYDFGEQQYSAIFDAVLNGMKKYGDTMNMQHFQEELAETVQVNKAAKTVISKMSPFFHSIEFKEEREFDWKDVLYSEEAVINIFQLTLINREMQIIITELMLWDAWYYTKKYGSKDKPFVVVLDEAQNLSHKINSPSASILTEGRKFGWSAWFATQSLKILKDDEVVRLLQAAFKLYFKPTADEMIRIAKQLDPSGKNSWLADLKGLKKGQCIVVGDRQKSSGAFGSLQPTVTDIISFEKR